MADIQTQLGVKLTNNTNTAAITAGNCLQVDGSTVTQPVSGTITHVPSGTQDVTGTVTLTSQTVTIADGTVTTVPSGTQTITGTVVASVGGEISTGIIAFYDTEADVANASTGTLSYTVTTGTTLFLKQIIASSSGAPCKVTVDYGSGPTLIAVGFYATSSPFLAITFAQPILIAANEVVNVKIQNNCGTTQDVYAFINGHEI